MEDVLGRDGAAALRTAAERAPDLEGSLAPRTALAWSRLATAQGYDGPAPGRPEAALLVKSGGWTVRVGDVQTSGSGEAGLAAALLVMCDAAGRSRPAVGQPLLRLGKSLDALAAAVWERRRVPTVKDIRDRARGMAKANRGGGGGGASAPGPAHKPSAPEAPTPPTPSQKQPGVKATSPAAPKAPKAQGAKGPRQAQFMRSELEAPCRACGRPQMSGDDLALCACFQAVAKAVSFKGFGPDTVVVSFDGWDAEALATFCEEVRRG